MRATKAEEKSQRLFFALWPSDALRQQIFATSKPLLQSVRGRAVLTENFHITLAFLGNIDARQHACIECMADAIVSPPFELKLDQFGYWPRPRALWLGPKGVPEALPSLADGLAVGAKECGLTLDDRPYRPHLTLMRKVPRESGAVSETMSVEPMPWWVESFVLVRSVSVPQGVFYDVLREWPLNDND